jgi:hypothetical protein
VVAAALAAAGLVLARAFHQVCWPATLAAVRHAGSGAPFILLPFLLAMLLDAGGLVLLLRPLGHAVSMTRMLPIRIATEALHLTAPAGFVVADSATAALLDAQSGVPLGQGAILVVARKWLVMRAHAVYIVIGALAGAPLLAPVSERAFGGRWLPFAVAASALIPFVLSALVGSGFRSGALLARLQGLVSRLPGRALGARAAAWSAPARALDAHMQAIGRSTSRTWTAAAAFFGCWILESIETAVILALAGGPSSLGLALGAEVGISLLRSVGNVAPAGLGIQDAGYAALLPAMGVSVDVAAAFVLLKRAKELAWILVGYALLAGLRRGDRTPTDQVRPREAKVTKSPRLFAET